MTNLTTGRSLRRHKWVYLGSRFAKVRADDEEERFIADLEGNLINLSFFYQGNTLLTASLPQCVEQTIWVANNGNQVSRYRHTGTIKYCRGYYRSRSESAFI